MCFERRLLRLMSQNEFMYNPDHPDYDRALKRKKCWEAIAKELGTDVDHCRTKWFSLRGTYRKLLYKIKSEGGIINQKKKWKYFDDISFINKFDCMPLLVGYQTEKWKESEGCDEKRPPNNFEYRLIELIHEHEVLYNTDHPGYDDVDERNYAWQTISEELNIGKNALKAKWHSLRSAFAKVLRKINISGGLANYERRWHYFDYMSFLIPFMGIKMRGDLTEGSGRISTDDFICKDDSLDIKPSNFADNEDDEDVQFVDKGAVIKRRRLSMISSSVDDVTDFKDEPFDVSDSFGEEGEEEDDEEKTELSDYNMFKSHAKSKTSVNNNKSQRCADRSNAFDKVSAPSPCDGGEAGAAGPCTKYFSLLGAKIDETAVPIEVRYLLEKQVTDLVYDVLAKYSLETVQV